MAGGDKPSGGWNAWLLLVIFGTFLMWIVQGITWPFRALSRWFKGLR